MTSGIVKWFNIAKGYGFITPEDGGRDIFVHLTAVKRSGLLGLQDQQKVRFEVDADRVGRQSASNIHIA